MTDARLHMTALRQLVAYLIRGSGSGPRATDLPEALVRSHMLSPLAFRAGYQRYENDYIAASMRADARERSLAEAIELLTRAGVRVVLLKGVSYTGTLYDSPGERPMSDIDLLVQAPQLATAAHALMAAGYRDVGSPESHATVHHAMQLMREDDIDLHRTIVQPLRSRIDLAAVWARALPAPERDDGALRLDPVDEALFHFAHAARHELRVPAINFVDGARLLARLSPAQHAALADRARAYRLERAVRVARAMTRAFADGADGVSGAPLMPTCSEVLTGETAWRPLQLVRKALLLDGPRELVGLATVYALEKLSRLGPGRDV